MLNHLITNNQALVIGPTNKKVKNVLNIASKGVNKLSNTVGMILRNPFSIVAKI